MSKMTRKQFDAACKRRGFVRHHFGLGYFRCNGISVSIAHLPARDYGAQLAHLIREFERLESVRDAARKAMP